MPDKGELFPYSRAKAVQMGRFRFSLLSLMALVLILATAFAALRSATEAWASATFSIALLVLLLAVLAAIFVRGRDRAFWVGASLVGWIYLLFVYAPWFEVHVGGWLATTQFFSFLESRIASRGANLATVPTDDSKILKLYFTVGQNGSYQMPNSIQNVANSNPAAVGTLVDKSDPTRLLLKATSVGTAVLSITDQGSTLETVRVVVGLNREAFHRIGHSLAALLFALLGGLAARYFATRLPRGDAMLKAVDEDGSSTPL